MVWWPARDGCQELDASSQRTSQVANIWIFLCQQWTIMMMLMMLKWNGKVLRICRKYSTATKPIVCYCVPLCVISPQPKYLRRIIDHQNINILRLCSLYYKLHKVYSEPLVSAFTFWTFKNWRYVFYFYSESNWANGHYFPQWQIILTLSKLWKNLCCYVRLSKNTRHVTANCSLLK